MVRRLSGSLGCRPYSRAYLSLYCKELDAVIVGDAFALEQNTPVLANPQFTLDVEMAKRSMERLLSLKARTYYCYHGGGLSAMIVFSPVCLQKLLQALAVKQLQR